MSSNPIRLVNLGRAPYPQTQAVYHSIAEMMTVDSPDTIIVTEPLSPYLCLGYHQVYEAVVDPEVCQRKSLPVLRRALGGGLTYLDDQQLFYQYVFHHSRLPVPVQDVYARLLAAPLATLRHLGLDATLRRTNEIEVDGKRIAGIGGGRIEEACVVVGNFLFDFDYETMSQVWRVPWKSFRELATIALGERITTLRQLVGPVSVHEVQWLLSEEFGKAFNRPVLKGRLTDEELAHCDQVAKRLASQEYLGLHSPKGHPVEPIKSLKISAGVFILADQISLGNLTIRGSFQVSEGVIQEVRLQSDPLRSWNQLETQMQGVRFRDWQKCCKAWEFGDGEFELRPRTPAGSTL